MRPVVKGLTHDHTDGSEAALDCMYELYAINDIREGDARHRTPDQVRALFANVHDNLVQKFGMAITSLLQSKEAIRTLGYAYGRRRAAEGYTYVEAKFAPQYSTGGGLTMRAATAAMCEGLWKAQADFGIRIVPQLCIGREADMYVGIEIAHIALDYDGAVKLDLACDEAGHPPEKHYQAYKQTFGSKVGRDCHAGEWVAAEPAATYRQRLVANIRTAVGLLQCHGVGQAIALCDDDELIREVADKGVRVSYCPLSNKMLGLIKDVRELRIDEMLDRGVRATLNSDDDLFLPPMDKVLDECEAAYHFTEAQAAALARNALPE